MSSHRQESPECGRTVPARGGWVDPPAGCSSALACATGVWASASTLRTTQSSLGTCLDNCKRQRQGAADSRLRRDNQSICGVEGNGRGCAAAKGDSCQRNARGSRHCFCGVCRQHAACQRRRGAGLHVVEHGSGQHASDGAALRWSAPLHRTAARALHQQPLNAPSDACPAALCRSRAWGTTTAPPRGLVAPTGCSWGLPPGRS